MPDWVPTAAAVAALLAHLMVGYFYAISGLVAPTWAVVMLLVWWFVLLVAGIVMWRRRSLWVLAVPGIALVTWIVVLTAGDAWLGWTA